MEDIFERLYDMTAFSNIIAEPQFLIMYAIAFILLYLGIKKKYEPLLLIPIAFGVLLANFPGGEMGVVQADENGMVMVNGALKNIWEMPLHEIAHDLGLMNFIYYMLIKTGFLPPIIFMGVGALTDFGPMLRNLRLSIFGAAAQLGIFTVLLVAILMGFTPKEAASLGIIGGADGPTAIFTTIKLAPHLLGPIAIAAYSYMALVPVIIPLVVKIWCTKKELSINMKEQEKKYPSSVEIKNLRVLKIVFPIVVTTVVALFVPSAVPLIGMLMFGNLIKEIGSDTSRLFDAASNSIMNAATIFLGLSVGATMTTEAFFKLGFLDPTAVSLGMRISEMLPTLWLKTGAKGKCPELTGEQVPDMLILPENQFAVLINENTFADFAEKLAEHPEIQTVFLATDYEVNYQSMVKNLNVENAYQLYQDYLDHFRVNRGRN